MKITKALIQEILAEYETKQEMLYLCNGSSIFKTLWQQKPFRDDMRTLAQTLLYMGKLPYTFAHEMGASLMHPRLGVSDGAFKQFTEFELNRMVRRTFLKELLKSDLIE